MAKFGETGELLKCSFCGKSQKQVKKLIAGPGVYLFPIHISEPTQIRRTSYAVFLMNKKQ